MDALKNVSPFPDEVDIADIGAAKEIHKIGERYLKAGFYTHIGHKSAKTLFSTTDPKFHAVRRKLLSPPMSESSITTFEPIVYEKVRLCMTRMSEEMKIRGVADVYKWWTFLATDVIGELSFGESFRMLEYGKKNQYISDLESVSSLMAVRTTFPELVKLSTYLPIPVFKRAAESGARMGSYAGQSIERYKTLIQKNPSNPKPTLFTKLFNAGEGGLTDFEIRLEAGGYITAGSDTAAVTLTYLVHAVCRKKEIQEKLVAEVGTLPDNFTNNDAKELPYLEQVINETLRLYPAVPGALPRAVPPEGANLAGYQFPGGVTVSTQAYSLHRDPDIFPDPERFDPARWAMLTKEMKAAFMPFGGGSRICVGMALARMEMRLATAHFFRTFPHAKISVKEGMTIEEMEPKMYFLVAPQGHRCLLQLS
ncbi:hypothetical protein P7C71_g942, partial [Lecanoromycetidae sp. Uapishka_2]